MKQIYHSAANAMLTLMFGLADFSRMYFHGCVLRNAALVIITAFLHLEYK